MVNQHRDFILVAQVIGTVSFTITTVALINASYLYLLQRLNDDANSAYSISLAVIFIFLGDSLANGPYLSEYRPPDGSIDCTISGFIHVGGYMMTWMFTGYVSYAMYSTAVWERLPTNILRDFSLCFGIPIIVTSCQAAFFGFSQYRSSTYEICFSTLKDKVETTYKWVTFWGVLFTVFLAMIIMRCHQFLLELREDPRTQTKLFLVSKTMLQYYPLVLILCWIPSIIETNTGPQSPQWFHLFSTLSRMSHGILVGSIYFVLGDQSRKYFWQALNPLAWM
jgi:hypothetical protein